MPTISRSTRSVDWNGLRRCSPRMAIRSGAFPGVSAIRAEVMARRSPRSVIWGKTPVISSRSMSTPPSGWGSAHQPASMPAGLVGRVLSSGARCFFASAIIVATWAGSPAAWVRSAAPKSRYRSSARLGAPTPRGTKSNRCSRTRLRAVFWNWRSSSGPSSGGAGMGLGPVWNRPRSSWVRARARVIIVSAPSHVAQVPAGGRCLPLFAPTRAPATLPEGGGASVFAGGGAGGFLTIFTEKGSADCRPQERQVASAARPRPALGPGCMRS